MSITISYILSQIFTVAMYILHAMTYHIKSRKKILILSFLSQMFYGIAFVLLGAYSGLAMCIVAVTRNAIFLIDESKNGKRDTITKMDIIYLIMLYALIIFSTIITYQGIYSLFSIIATMIYTYSVWQKNTKVYKMLGIPTEIFWILYNLSVKSVFGVIIESALLIAATSGYIVDNRNEAIEDLNNSVINM